ncbi:Ankyrin repeat-containing protein [Filimonas lacunae]|uniref:Ankyrin repeat-containing protein n=1 Tax=Filimonas lacunae TaxID=477680 RepID=A0A173MB96_9BACT|nr:ankyrin repeat domain-containing protein [Filimonas lacunae]BAV04748.1 ankyrin repeat protein [Filimonas lacunae]SIT32190.1 Ankyrin repeat-containing protein [Filimonas lacunae]
MTSEKAVAEAIMRGNFSEAREQLQNGEPLSGQYVENNKSQIINSILRGKAFDLIDKLIEHGLIETDVYEYDTLDRSVFKNIAMSLKGEEDTLTFLRSFLQKIQNKNDEVRDTTVLQFCMEEAADPAIIKCLIEQGCDVQYKNNADMNLIYSVINKGMLDEAKGKAYIELLLSNGVDVNHRNIVGTTPLMLAVQRGKNNYLDLLLQNGADANELDNKGNSAFYYAVVEQQNKSAYDKLKEYTSPDFDSANKEGEYILTGYLRMAYAASPDTIALLLQMLEDGASIYQASPYYHVPKSGIDWLAEKAPEALKAVLTTGVIDINRQDDQGNTILHKVCAFNVNYDQDAARKLYQKVKLLLEAGADATITNNQEETPMMLAAKDNLKVKTVDLLMQHKNN